MKHNPIHKRLSTIPTRLALILLVLLGGPLVGLHEKLELPPKARAQQQCWGHGTKQAPC